MDNIENILSPNLTNQLLSYNISLLQSFPITHYNYLLNEVEIQKKENSLLEENNKNLLLETTRLKRKLALTEDELYNEKEINNPRKKKKISKYEFYKYNKTKYSYSDEKINELISKITNIDNIIELKKDWQGIRHNKELQKLSQHFDKY